MRNDKMDLVAVIMAGGAGTRFWPLSTEEMPKQFLKIFDDFSLLQKTFDRVSGLVPHKRTLVLTNRAFVNLVREQLPDIPPENVIGEPLRRDTAAAVCLGVVLSRQRFGNPVIVTLTADHIIEPLDVFHKTLLSAARLARESGVLYTFGVQPTYPATNYGYLEVGPKVADDDGVEHFQLLSFKEKPDVDAARCYVEQGGFLWNSGMFVWTADSILREIETHLPNHLLAISQVARFDCTPHWDGALKKAFESLTRVSIDHGVMEKVEQVRCVASRFSWTDVGGWEALRTFLSQDKAGNSYRGHTVTLDATNNLVYCEDRGEMVMVVGIEDLVVVRAGQKTLIAHKDHIEKIKQLVESIQGKCGDD